MIQIIERDRLKKFRFLALVLVLAISILAPAAEATAAPEKMLVPMGSTVGIQIRTDGVMVVGLSATGNGSLPSPAAVAGIVPGDLIIALGANKVGGAEDFKQAVQKLDGEPVSVTLIRGGETLQCTLNPQMGTGSAELGLWLRDCISGIGTLTYFDPETGKYGGLGHSINDVDSGMRMPLGSGEILHASVASIVKGCPGSPGELCGSFDTQSICGSIEKNTCSGIFGTLEQHKPQEDNAIPMGFERDISLGEATILSNISGTDVEEFQIEIVRIYRGDDANRSMMIKVTDPRLIESTGGIVQGMSGSPIIQNGKLVGAVTHVMINDPTSGFAVSAEKMLKSSEF